jgi:hypothetical protein
MNTAAANFTTRTLMVLREDVVALVETTDRVRAMFDAMAKENGVMPIEPTRTKRTDKGRN